MSVRAFVAFGHDTQLADELAAFLTNSCGLQACLLASEDDLTMTVVEKFEHYASRCDLAFVVFTPDDMATTMRDALTAPRARQNVVLELGWFMAKLGRRRVVIIQKGGIEVPSDILGVLVCRVTASIYEVSDQIRQRLRTLGLAPT